MIAKGTTELNEIGGEGQRRLIRFNGQLPAHALAAAQIPAAHDTIATTCHKYAQVVVVKNASINAAKIDMPAVLAAQSASPQTHKKNTMFCS